MAVVASYGLSVVLRILTSCLRLLVLLALPLATQSAFAKDGGDIGPPDAADAPIALLVDISSGQVLHARNAGRRFIPASITKTMTAFVAFELMNEKRLSPTQVMTITPETWREWNGKGSTMWLDATTPTRVEDLLTGIMTVSANDASIALAEGAAGSVPEWAAMMNATARRLGMTGSHFATPNGWPDEGRTFTTANDLVLLAEALIRRHPKKFAHYVGRKEFPWNGITQENHDPLLGNVTGADGIKTGFTNEAGFGFLGTVKRGSQRLVLVLAGVKRKALRARVARDYAEWGFAAFDRERLFAKGQRVGEARVQGGSSRSVALAAERTAYVNVPAGRSGELEMAISYDGPLRAPIKEGARVATLEVTAPGMEPARIPLLAEEAVGEAGFFSRVWNGLTGWVS